MALTVEAKPGSHIDGTTFAFYFNHITTNPFCLAFFILPIRLDCSPVPIRTGEGRGRFCWLRAKPTVDTRAPSRPGPTTTETVERRWLRPRERPATLGEAPVAVWSAG